MSSRLGEARIPRAWWHMTRQTWKESSPTGRATPWPRAISEWARGARGPIVTILGSAGIGKSHIAVATLRYYLDSVGPWGRVKWWFEGSNRRDGGVFFTARELEAEFQATKFRRPLLDRALRAPLVVVDDIIWDRSKVDIQTGAVAALIHNSDQTGAGLIMTGNITADFMVGDFDGRIASRLSTGIILELEGEDRR